MRKHKIIVAVTGASGSIYANVLLRRLTQLNNQIEEVGLVMSDNAKDVWKYELGNEDFKNANFKLYNKGDFFSPFASGSAQFNIMFICPCSMGTMGRIASGISNNLITRAADVILKERRKLILVSRDTPLNLIHINNMKHITEAGGIIMPASPSFYSKPKDFKELALTVIDRALDLAGLDISTFRWGDN